MDSMIGTFSSNLTFGSVIVRACFISTARWKYSLFSSFPLGGLQWLRHFVGYSLGTSYKKASTFFYGTAQHFTILTFKTRSLRHWTAQTHCACAFAAPVCFPQPEEPFQHENALLVIPLEFQEKNHQSFPMAQPWKGFPRPLRPFRQRLRLGGITGKEGEILQPPSQHISLKKALLEYVVVSSPQYFENTAFFSVFPLGGSHG